jgi:hypothetical protein
MDEVDEFRTTILARGWEELGQTFSWVASRFSNVSDFRFDVEVVGVSGDMAYTLGFERFNGSIAGRPVEPGRCVSRTSTGERTVNGRSFTATPTTRGATLVPPRLGAPPSPLKAERTAACSVSSVRMVETLVGFL